MQKAFGPHRIKTLLNNYRSVFFGIAVFLLSAASANAQIIPNPNKGNYGTRYNRVAIDSTLYFPTGCGIPTDTTFLFSQQNNGKGQKAEQAALYYDSCGHHAYLWDPSLKLWHVADSSSGGGGSDSGFSVQRSILGGVPIQKSVVGSARFILWDTAANNPGGITTQSSRQKLVDSLNLIFNSLFKLSTDSVRLSGYTTIANKNKLADSLTANFNALISSYKLGNDSVRLSGYTTIATKNKLADSLTANFNALLALYKLKGDSVALGGYTTVAHANKIADSLRAVFNTLLGGKVDTGTKANIYFIRQGDPAGDTSYVSGHDSDVVVASRKDSLDFHTRKAADGTRTSYVDAHDTLSANALQPKYDADTARIRQDAALAGKMTNFGGAPGQLQGTFAGIPAATGYATGTTYIAQDSGFQYVDTGSGGSRGWKKMAGGSSGGVSQNFQQVTTVGNTTTTQVKITKDTLFTNYATQAGYIQSGDSVISLLDSVYGVGTSWEVGTTGDGSPVLGGSAALLANFFGRNLVNMGVNGTTLVSRSDGTSRMENLAQLPTWNSRYKLIWIEYGLNDAHFALSTTTFQANMQTVIDTLVARGWPLSKIKIFGPGWNNGTYAPSLSGYIAAASAAAAARSVEFVDVYAGMVARGVTGLIGADGIHPGAAGYAAVAQIEAHGITGINFAGNGLVNGGLTVQKAAIFNGLSTFNGREAHNNLIVNRGGNASVAAGVGFSNLRFEIGRINNNNNTDPIVFAPNSTDGSQTFADSLRISVFNNGGRPELAFLRNAITMLRFPNAGGAMFDGAQQSGFGYTFNNASGVYVAGPQTTNGVHTVNAGLIVGGDNQQRPQGWLLYKNSTARAGIGYNSSIMNIFNQSNITLGNMNASDGTTYTPVMTIFSVNGRVGIGPGVTDDGSHTLIVNGTSAFSDVGVLNKIFSYATNLGSSFTSRTLIDKGYADSANTLRRLISDTVGNTSAATNGHLNKSLDSLAGLIPSAANFRLKSDTVGNTSTATNGHLNKSLDSLSALKVLKDTSTWTGNGDPQTRAGVQKKIDSLAALSGGGSTGSYKPTITNVINVTSSTADSAHWDVNNNTVHVAGHVSITVTSASSSTQIRIQVPINSNMGASSAFGCATNLIAPGIIGYVSGTNVVTLTFLTNAGSAGGLFEFYYVYTYKIY